jgi:lipopolysaccharide biosynthesis protein
MKEFLYRTARYAGAPIRYACASTSFLASLARRRQNYVRQRWPGALDLDAATRVAVFAHFDRQGVVDDFILHYLAAISHAGFTTVFVSNAPRLSSESLSRLTPLCGAILRRANVGLDFGAFKDGMATLRPERLEALLLVNDSVYGPFRDLADVMSGMNLLEADVWGITDSWQHHYHLQSYFLLFGQRALTSPVFSRFWSRLRYIQSKSWVVKHYEIGLTRALLRAGLRCRALFPYRVAATTAVEAVRREMTANSQALAGPRQRFAATLVAAVEAGRPLNPSHYFWDPLISRMGCPFLKRDLLRKNPARIPGLVHWQDVIQVAGKYDTDLIVRHLERSVRNRAI